MRREDPEPRASIPATERNPSLPYSSCGVAHDSCPSAVKGSCDRGPGHDGAHHCSACYMQF